MRTMTFQIDDATTDTSANPAVMLTIAENGDGRLNFSVTQQGSTVGDLRGLFFDVNAVADGTLARSLMVSAATAASALKAGDDSVTDLGNGANMNGLTSSNRDGGFDAGIAIGTAGLGSDDIRSFSFTLSSSLRGLTLDDFSNVDFGARLTSVGTLGGSRAASSKIIEVTAPAIKAANDASSAVENAATAGNLLGNDVNSQGATLTGWSGGALGAAVFLDNAAGATLTVNADGTYTLDAHAAEALSDGETITQTFSYVNRLANPDQTSSASAHFTVTLNGVNDAPEAGNDGAATTENTATATGTVLANDRDVDRLDTIAVTALNGQTLGQPVAIANGAGATFTLNADGTYVLDATAADALSAGETVTQAFAYTLADDHGATATATVNVSVTGANDAPVARNDAYQVQEGGAVSGRVLGNDSDVDRLDVLNVSDVNGHQPDGKSFALQSGATVTVNTDGTFSYETNGAFDYLNTGESATDSFQYTVGDGHGAFSTATASVVIAGTSPVTPPPTDRFPAMAQNISNVVLYLDDGIAATPIQNVKLQPEGHSLTDVDLLKIDQFIAGHGDVLGANSHLIGISIHAGTTYPDADYTARGEGVFYFLNDSTPVEAVGVRNGNTFTTDWGKDDIPLSEAALAVGLTIELLGVQAQTVYNHFDQGSGIWTI
ncbi:MAG: cadherin-like domain-containing protein [Betaproteobacteria bacterium]|nr:cadherin-like domain-containing protein [Betaproteobacteria bacterium]